MEVRRSSLSVRTTTGLRKSSWLGTTTSCPSTWRMRLSRMVICSIWPSTPSHSTKSPMRNGSRKRMRMPARKFSNVSLNAKPIATEPSPSVVSALLGVMVGNAIVRAISPPMK